MVSPCTIAPLKPSRVTARSSSAAAATGSAVGSEAKAAKRSGMGGDGLGKAVIGAAREPHGKLGIRHFLRARRGVRQNLNVDAGRVHLGDAALADIVEAGHDMRPSRSIDPGRVPFHLGIEVVLFKRDHLRSHAHFFSRRPVLVGIS